MMGADIHIEVFVRMHGDKYIRVPHPGVWLWDEDTSNPVETGWPAFRDYAAFGRMCDGFRGNPGRFPARGIPGWLKETEMWKRNESLGYDLGNPDRLDLGEHSYSWLTLLEFNTIDWVFDDGDIGTYLMWPGEVLKLLLMKLGNVFGTENVIIVFGFDS